MNRCAFMTTLAMFIGHSVFWEMKSGMNFDTNMTVHRNVCPLNALCSGVEMGL